MAHGNVILINRCAVLVMYATNFCGTGANFYVSRLKLPAMAQLSSQGSRFSISGYFNNSEIRKIKPQMI